MLIMPVTLCNSKSDQSPNLNLNLNLNPEPNPARTTVTLTLIGAIQEASSREAGEIYPRAWIYMDIYGHTWVYMDISAGVALSREAAARVIDRTMHP